ncbi:hypothetical protein [Kushneria marisflavi]|uniref:Uncharacterized protein n=1 Tax=Kushneria marisflavi TaxID=157779 RepID=A0A240UPY8_9GAMM|nr:hypothetical protein [Kushneria marisflavi]ART63196.1 hypothetical protein B9H00_09130 [Kushneria marisflavi]RKD84219.1 hypothetical protein C8D96_2277 [Kushneria marisflavi]
MSEYHHHLQVFDNAFNQLPHYSAYPLMRPFVGRGYGQHGPKILLVAESHYLPLESSLHLNAQRWYDGSEKDLDDTDKPCWIHTRKIIDKKDGKWTAKGHEIYRRLNRALSEAGYSGDGNLFRYVAFMNGFQRPAVTGESLEVQGEDIEVATQTINGVIDIIEPECVIFVSTKAKRYLAKHLDIESEGVPHPACAWWYRPTKHGTGKERFINVLSGLYSGVEAD